VWPSALPGAGTRILEPEAQREFWYPSFHRLDLAEQPAASTA
jgi:hypothetical protein